MAPVMWGLFALAVWADRLFRHNYSDKFPPPTSTDFTRAAMVLWIAVLTPVAVGLVAAAVAFRKSDTEREWETRTELQPAAGNPGRG